MHWWRCIVNIKQFTVTTAQLLNRKGDLKNMLDILDTHKQRHRNTSSVGNMLKILKRTEERMHACVWCIRLTERWPPSGRTRDVYHQRNGLGTATAQHFKSSSAEQTNERCRSFPEGMECPPTRHRGAGNTDTGRLECLLWTTSPLACICFNYI